VLGCVQDEAKSAFDEWLRVKREQRKADAKRQLDEQEQQKKDAPPAADANKRSKRQAQRAFKKYAPYHCCICAASPLPAALVLRFHFLGLSFFILLLLIF